jgi:hypothetical protein
LAWIRSEQEGARSRECAVRDTLARQDADRRIFFPPLATGHLPTYAIDLDAFRYTPAHYPIGHRFWITSNDHRSDILLLRDNAGADQGLLPDLPQFTSNDDRSGAGRRTSGTRQGDQGVGSQAFGLRRGQPTSLAGFSGRYCRITVA